MGGVIGMTIATVLVTDALPPLLVVTLIVITAPEVVDASSAAVTLNSSLSTSPVVLLAVNPSGIVNA